MAKREDRLGMSKKDWLTNKPWLVRIVRLEKICAVRAWSWDPGVQFRWLGEGDFDEISGRMAGRVEQLAVEKFPELADEAFCIAEWKKRSKTRS